MSLKLPRMFHRLVPPGGYLSFSLSLWLWRYNLRNSSQRVGTQKFTGISTQIREGFPIGSYGTCIFTYIDHKKSTIHVGKYTSPMDPMGVGFEKIHDGT